MYIISIKHIIDWNWTVVCRYLNKLFRFHFTRLSHIQDKTYTTTATRFMYLLNYLIHQYLPICFSNYTTHKLVDKLFVICCRYKYYKLTVPVHIWTDLKKDRFAKEQILIPVHESKLPVNIFIGLWNSAIHPTDGASHIGGIYFQRTTRTIIFIFVSL